MHRWGCAIPPIREIRVIRGQFSLETRRMPRDETARVAPVQIPAWAHIAAAAQIRCVEAEAGNDREGVALS